MHHFEPQNRRRIYLMRHGHVDYFKSPITPLDSKSISLSALGQQEAIAAGKVFAQHQIQFDRVITSTLPRTQETAQLILQTTQQTHLTIQKEVNWNEIDIDLSAPHSLLDLLKKASFLQSNGLFERILPTFHQLQQDTHWNTALIVLHGGVNLALLSYFMTHRTEKILNHLEQSSGCINIIDLGLEKEDWIIRTINYSPSNALFHNTRNSVLENLILEQQNAGKSTSPK